MSWNLSKVVSSSGGGYVVYVEEFSLKEDLNNKTAINGECCGLGAGKHSAGVSSIIRYFVCLVIMYR